MARLCSLDRGGKKTRTKTQRAHPENPLYWSLIPWKGTTENLQKQKNWKKKIISMCQNTQSARVTIWGALSITPGDADEEWSLWPESPHEAKRWKRSCCWDWVMDQSNMYSPFPPWCVKGQRLQHRIRYSVSSVTCVTFIWLLLAHRQRKRTVQEKHCFRYQQCWLPHPSF